MKSIKSASHDNGLPSTTATSNLHRMCMLVRWRCRSN